MRSTGWPTRPAMSLPRPLRPDEACRHPSCAPPNTLLCACTARPAQHARSAETRSGNTRSPVLRRSTARPARPAGRCSPEAAPPGSRGYDGSHDDFSAARPRDPPSRRRRQEPAHGLGFRRIVLRRFRLRHGQLTHRLRSVLDRGSLSVPPPSRRTPAMTDEQLLGTTPKVTRILMSEEAIYGLILVSG